MLAAQLHPRTSFNEICFCRKRRKGGLAKCRVEKMAPRSKNWKNPESHKKIKQNNCKTIEKKPKERGEAQGAQGAPTLSLLVCFLVGFSWFSYGFQGFWSKNKRLSNIFGIFTKSVGFFMSVAVFAGPWILSVRKFARLEPNTSLRGEGKSSGETSSGVGILIAPKILYASNARPTYWSLPVV